MNEKDREEIIMLIEKAVGRELDSRHFLSVDQITKIASDSTAQTLSITLKLMGVKYKDNGEIDFETAYQNNDYVTRLRRGSNQIKRLAFNSCFVTALTTGLAFALAALWDKILATIPPTH
jgi:hypothetical protein